MSYFVTGATGLVGRHLVEELLAQMHGDGVRSGAGDLQAGETEQIMLAKVLKGVHW